MNDFFVYVNGVLVGPTSFDVVVQNTSKGRVAVATAPDAFFRNKDVKSLDVVEVRAGRLTKRYRYEHVEDDKNFKVLEENVDDKIPARRRFICDSVPNSF